MDGIKIVLSYIEMELLNVELLAADALKVGLYVTLQAARLTLVMTRRLVAGLLHFHLHN